MKKISVFNQKLALLFVVSFLSIVSFQWVFAFSPPSAQIPDLETRYIVKFRDAPGLSSQQSAQTQAFEQDRVVSQNRLVVRKRMEIANALSVVVNAQQLSRLRADASVEYVELDQPRRFLAQSSPYGITAVQANVLSDSQAGNTTVCIIDSGYEINHPDLSANTHSGSNDPGTGSWFIPGGSHGTHVAGTIAAVNNSDGVVGVLPNTNINLHIVKVFNASGWGYSSDLVAAIQTCANNGANVVNMSLGGSSSSNTERNALQNIADNGVLLIAAAGNDGTTAHSYPASYNSVVSVAAVDDNNDHAEFSQATNQVELAGPGVAVLSTVGLGDGQQSAIFVGTQTFGDDRVVPHNRYVQVGQSFINEYVGGSASGPLAVCGLSNNGNYSCGNMSGQICLAERFENESSSGYPEIDPVLACVNAGASAAIVYSNAALPGLQNPFLVDASDDVDIPTVSVSRALGQSLLASVGQFVSVTTELGTDYAYYNGTSMATPHVTGVAALVWSLHPDCSAADIRSALTSTALDLDTGGRDNRTGFGLVQSEAASNFLSANPCDNSGGGGGSDAEVLQNGVAVSGLSAASNDVLSFEISVPAGASNLDFQLSGGSGDADLYVQFATEPDLNNYDCRPYLNGNNENCNFASPQAGTWYVNVVAFSSFSNVTLVASFDEPGSGGGAESFQNNTDFAIPDRNNSGVRSPIQSTRSGASGIVTIDVEIIHTYIGDLIVDVIHPDGSTVVLHNRSGGSANNIIESYVVDFGSRDSSGQWQLRVRDRARFDTGFIDRWQINFE